MYQIYTVSENYKIKGGTITNDVIPIAQRPDIVLIYDCKQALIELIIPFEVLSSCSALKLFFTSMDKTVTFVKVFENTVIENDT